VTDRERELELDRLTMRFLDALESEDLDAVDLLFQHSAPDSEAVLRFVDAAAEWLGERDANDRTVARNAVADALRRAAPTLETIAEVSSPLTVAEAAEHLRRKGAPGLTAAEFAINDALATCADPLPDSLTLPAIEGLSAKFGSAPRAYWKALKQAALELKLRRSSSGEYRIAARPQRPKPKGDAP
jgi:hypothetical protein